RNIVQLENYSLLALSSLYGIELLEDNAQKCAINLYEVYYYVYQIQTDKFNTQMKDNVLNSAKLIISKNISQGNFLTKLSGDHTPIIFSKWEPLQFHDNSDTIDIQRTEFTLDEIFQQTKKHLGETLSSERNNEQIDIFDLLCDDEES